jgi:hypothetical protein
MREVQAISVGAPVALQGEEPPARADHDLLVVGHGRIVKPKHGCLVAPESVLSAADVDSLGAAARDPRRCCAEIPEHIYVATSTLLPLTSIGMRPIRSALWSTTNMSMPSCMSF